MLKAVAAITEKTLEFIRETSRKEIGFNCSPQDDEALQKYKMALLGQAAGGSGTVVVDESDPRKVIFEQQPFILTLSLIR